MLNSLYKWFAIAGAAIVALFGIWASGRKAGKDTATVEATQAKMEDVKRDAAAAVEDQQKVTTITVNSVRRANEVATKVNSADSGAAADQLRKRYSRD